jgi:hypothetical protein
MDVQKLFYKADNIIKHGPLVSHQRSSTHSSDRVQTLHTVARSLHSVIHLSSTSAGWPDV